MQVRALLFVDEGQAVLQVLDERPCSLLVAMPGAPSSVLAPSSKARSPYSVLEYCRYSASTLQVLRVLFPVSTLC